MKQFNPYPVTQSGRPDMRYRVALEHCGHAKAQFVIRFCDEFICSTPSYSAAVLRALGHNQVRLGALVIEGIPA